MSDTKMRHRATPASSRSAFQNSVCAKSRLERQHQVSEHLGEDSISSRHICTIPVEALLRQG